jgi:hypothetical protein
MMRGSSSEVRVGRHCLEIVSAINDDGHIELPFYKKIYDALTGRAAFRLHICGPPPPLAKRFLTYITAVSQYPHHKRLGCLSRIRTGVSTSFLNRNQPLVGLVMLDQRGMSNVLEE